MLTHLITIDLTGRWSGLSFPTDGAARPRCLGRRENGIPFIFLIFISDWVLDYVTRQQALAELAFFTNATLGFCWELRSSARRSLSLLVTGMLDGQMVKGK